MTKEIMDKIEAEATNYSSDIYYPYPDSVKEKAFAKGAIFGYSLKADGLQFVKASERLPDKIYNYHVKKISTFSGDIYNDTSFWNGFEFEKKYVGESDKIIEWLDKSGESQQSKNDVPLKHYVKLCEITQEKNNKITELEKEIERLKEVMWNAFLCDVSDMPISRRNQYWQQFTKDNNL